jgi:hypothetical protein
MGAGGAPPSDAEPADAADPPPSAEPAPEPTAPAEPAPAQPTPAEPAPAEPAPPSAPPPEPVASEVSDAELDAMFDGEVEGATANVEAPPTESTKRTLTEEQLTTIPGTRGDPLRAIEVLPGVGRVPFGGGDGAPRLRGSATEDSRVLLDGVPVPILYHFGGLTSFFNPYLLEGVDLRPGNYSARFGRASAGIVDAHVRKAQPDKLHAALELSLIDNSILVDTPVGDDTSVALAARRSNIDFVFEQLVPEGTFNVTAAPVYYDYQGLVRHRFGKDMQLRVLAYGSHDHLELAFAKPGADDPTLHGSLEGTIEFHRLQAHLDGKLSERVSQTVVLSAGPQVLDQKFGDWSAHLDGFDVYGGAAWSVLASDHVRVDTGIDVESQFSTGYYSGPPPNDGESDPSSNDPGSTLGTVALEDSFTLFHPGAFAEVSVKPTDELLLIPGVRTDYQHESKAWSVDPRFGARHQTTEALALKAAAGLYTRATPYYITLPGIGNPEVDPERALQTSAGFELDPERRFHLDMEGFYKKWIDRISATPGGASPYFVNAGEGRAYGLETLIRANPLPDVDTLVSYTLMRSERQDEGGPWRAYTKDQTHNLSLVASYRVGAGVTLGARFRYVTGNPDTPVVGSVYSAELDQYRPVYGPIASVRRPAFHQLDVRVDKRWEMGPVALTTYLEVLNAYNAQNQEGTGYSYDFSESEPVTGMPIFPNIGVRGEL